MREGDDIHNFSELDHPRAAVTRVETKEKKDHQDEEDY
jgi:hypothetical protein